MEMTDSVIIDMYLSRNEDAVSATSEKYGIRLRRISRGIVGSDADAEECENDTYLKAWNSIPPNDPREYFFVYLSRIIRNISISRVRLSGALKRQANIVELTREMEECIPEDGGIISDDGEIAEIINGFLSEISAEKRNVFVRRYFYLDTVSDIAKRFSMSESRVKMMLSRLRKKLKEDLQKGGVF